VVAPDWNTGVASTSRGVATGIGDATGAAPTTELDGSTAGRALASGAQVECRLPLPEVSAASAADTPTRTGNGRSRLGTVAGELLLLRHVETVRDTIQALEALEAARVNLLNPPVEKELGEHRVAIALAYPPAWAHIICCSEGCLTGGAPAVQRHRAQGAALGGGEVGCAVVNTDQAVHEAVLGAQDALVHAPAPPSRRASARAFGASLTASAGAAPKH
jgi:hypothetical protein